MTSKKLQDVFNECSDKLVDISEVGQLSFKEYKSQLSKLDLVKLYASAASPKYLAKITRTMIEMAQSGDLLKSNDGRLFLTVNVYQQIQDKTDKALPRILSEKIKEKTDNADADAIIKATDYSGQRQSLGLKPAF